jgi:uncharacterized membrane protein
MSKIEDFLSAQDEAEIIEAIRIAEAKTSGEIRVHIEGSLNDSIEERALEVFYHFKMDNTKLQNGVLNYVAVNDKSFCIYGDKGINTVVASDFWDCTKDTIQNHFKQEDFKQGLIDGILNAGQELSKHFPWHHHHDTDELSNEISKG